MADVVVTVMIDGRQAFVAGAAGSPDPHGCVKAALDLAATHFAVIINASKAQVVTAPKPQDTSL